MKSEHNLDLSKSDLSVGFKLIHLYIKTDVVSLEIDFKFITMLLEVKAGEFCLRDHNFQLRKSKRFSLIDRESDKSGENQI